MKSTLICVPRWDERRFVCQKREGLRWPVTIRKCVFESERGGGKVDGKVRWEHARKEWVRAAELKEVGEWLALPKAIKVWFTHSSFLNKSTCRSLSLSFKCVGPTPPSPPHLLALFLPLALTWQNCESWRGFANVEDSCASCQSLRNLHLFVLVHVCGIGWDRLYDTGVTGTMLRRNVSKDSFSYNLCLQP